MLVYLDNNATTALDPRVLEAMMPYLREQYANPSSIHYFGQQARHAVETAREQVAAAIGAKPRQIVFTGGGTEANALAIRGTLAARPDKRHFVTTRIEHDSVLRLAEQLAREGYRVTYIGVDRAGRVDPAEFEAAMSDDTALASIMHANNETGVIQPIQALAEIAAARRVPLHTDATQSVGKLPVDVSKLPVSLLTMAAHKFHGPKGVGVLYIARGTRVLPQLLGGHQERDLRAGTENVAGVVGTGEAIRLAIEHLGEENTRVRGLRDRLEAGLLAGIPAAHPIGDREHRLPNTANIGFEGLQAEAILMLLSNEGICASSGSACSSGSLEPSHVLQAMGVPEAIAHGAIRFSLSRFNQDADVDRVLEIMPRAIERLRAIERTR
ncbi:MAG TPA: cysteine desulfurase NifS [Phycisphaerae bacterium]|nr:cysteine desulfurase NifS [Phycisphaerae bacterium]HOM53529.1 cysteine desulfurase NifS [Phycisphaerae bacterium]HOQ86628.1 cysteine desulfurase NifS [Phycisphaerae bacterium]HPU28053.1 cysteine desulfurase NifS [Phycisphaerae bacterium]HPZ97513.1 cysteine desulfurase NifS [Phycisphaerae bacterium]